MHGTTDFWQRDLGPDYSQGLTCSICGNAITNHARLCPGCAGKVREQMKRLVRLARQRHTERVKRQIHEWWVAGGLL